MLLKFFPFDLCRNCRSKRQSLPQLYPEMIRVNHHAVGMAAHNDEYIHMQNDTLLLISIFQEACPLSMRVRPEEYLDHFDFEIDRMGRVLKYLELAQGSARSDLGWKPAPMLMKIIAERLAHPPEKRKSALLTEDDRNSVRSLMMFRTSDVPEAGSKDATEFCCSVLVALGLMKKGRPGGYKPTRRLHEVMWYASLQRTAEAARELQDNLDARYLNF